MKSILLQSQTKNCNILLKNKGKLNLLRNFKINITPRGNFQFMILVNSCSCMMCSGNLFSLSNICLTIQNIYLNLRLHLIKIICSIRRNKMISVHSSEISFMKFIVITPLVMSTSNGLDSKPKLVEARQMRTLLNTKYHKLKKLRKNGDRKLENKI